MSIRSLSIWKFHMDFPYPYGLWIESLAYIIQIMYQLQSRPVFFYQTGTIQSQKKDQTVMQSGPIYLGDCITVQSQISRPDRSIVRSVRSAVPRSSLASLVEAPHCLAYITDLLENRSHQLRYLCGTTVTESVTDHGYSSPIAITVAR